MKVIDLLNDMAKGKNNEDNKYQFSYTDYCTIREFFDRYIVDEANLNLEIIEDTPKENRYINVCGSLFTKSEYDELAKSKEDKKIEKLNEYVDIGSFTNQIGIEDNLGFVHWSNDLKEGLDKQTNFNKNVLYKINEIIDRLNGEDNE